MEAPKLEFAFEINVQAKPLPEMGMKPKGVCKIINITGGSFEGPDIKGKVLPGGYDWQLVRNDGVIEIDARYLLQTEEGALITIVDSGLRHAPEAVMRQLTAGEEVDSSLYYFRSTPVFDTSDSRYEWLTRNVFVARGIRSVTGVSIEVWKVL